MIIRLHSTIDNTPLSLLLLSS